MATYAILTKVARPAVAEAIRSKYPNHMKFSETCHFVISDDSAKALSDALFDATSTRNGVIVMRVSASYYGYSKQEVWDWIAASFKAGSNG